MVQLKNGRAPPRRRREEAASDRTDGKTKKHQAEEQKKKKQRSAPPHPSSWRVRSECGYAARAQTLAAAMAGSVRFVRRRVPRQKREAGGNRQCAEHAAEGAQWRGGGGRDAAGGVRPVPPRSTRAGSPVRDAGAAGGGGTSPRPRARQPPECEPIRRGRARIRMCRTPHGRPAAGRLRVSSVRAVNQGSRPGGSMLPGELQEAPARRPARLTSRECNCRGSRHQWVHAARVLTTCPARRPARPRRARRTNPCGHPTGPRCSSVLVGRVLRTRSAPSPSSK